MWVGFAAGFGVVGLEDFAGGAELDEFARGAFDQGHDRAGGSGHLRNVGGAEGSFKIDDSSPKIS